MTLWDDIQGLLQGNTLSHRSVKNHSSSSRLQLQLHRPFCVCVSICQHMLPQLISHFPHTSIVSVPLPNCGLRFWILVKQSMHANRTGLPHRNHPRIVVCHLPQCVSFVMLCFNVRKQFWMFNVNPDATDPKGNTGHCSLKHFMACQLSTYYKQYRYHSIINVLHDFVQLLLG